MAKKKITKKKKAVKKDHLSELANEFDLEIMKEDSPDNIPYFIPFKHYGLQCITGGLPGGRMVSIDGDSMSGKSYLLYELGIECLKMDGDFLIFDVERAYNPKFGKRIGLKDGMRFMVSKENQLEKMFYLARNYVVAIRKKKKTTPILIGWDSFPPIQIKVSQEEIDSQTGEGLKGYIAARKNLIFGQFIGEFVSFLEKNNATFVLLNQTRKKMGVLFGDDTTTNCENMIQYFSTLRLRGKLGKKIKNSEKNKTLGIVSKWITIKNRTIEPFLEMETEIVFKTGVSPYTGLCEYLLKEKVFEKVKENNRIKYKYKNKTFTDNASNLEKIINDYPELLEREEI